MLRPRGREREEGGEKECREEKEKRKDDGASRPFCLLLFLRRSVRRVKAELEMRVRVETVRAGNSEERAQWRERRKRSGREERATTTALSAPQGPPSVVEERRKGRQHGAQEGVSEKEGCKTGGRGD